MVNANDLIVVWILLVGAGLLTGCVWVFVSIVDSATSGLDKAALVNAPRMPPAAPSLPPPPPNPAPPPDRRRLLFDVDNTTPTPWVPPLSPLPVPNTTAIAAAAQTIASAQVARMQRIDAKIAAARWNREHPSPSPTSRAGIVAKKRAGAEAQHDQGEGIEEARAHAYDLVQGAIAAEAAERLSKAAATVALGGISG